LSLFLQNPALLALLALAGLPALVHLLSRARPPEYRFSNVGFLKKVIRRTARFRRPKDWLLLALRTLAIAAIAAAFVSPLLVSNRPGLPGGKSTAVIVIDRSASMAAREGAGSRFDAASTQATQFLESSKPTAANIVWIDAQPSAAFPEPGPNLTFLTDLLKTSQPRPEAGSLNAAIDLALRQLAPVQGHRQLILISDFQSSAWRDFSPTLPSDVELITRNVATTSPPNIAVTRLLAQPSTPVVGQETTLLATLRNFSPDPIRTQLTLDADGSRQSQPIDLPPWGEAETAFPLKPASPGNLPVTASIDADSFPGDNSRHTVVLVRDAIRISLPEAESLTNTLLTKIIAALPWLERTTTPNPGDIHLPAPGTPTSEILRLAESGVTIIIPTPASADLVGLTDLFPTPYPLETNPTGWQILPNENHPAIQLFRSGDFGNPFAGSFRKRLKLPSQLTENPSVRTIATYSDAIPAILEITTKSAPILIFNLPLTTPDSDWSTQGVFLPAFAEILLRTRPSESTASSQTPPGSPLQHTATPADQGSAIDLLGPDGNPIELTESTSPDGSRWTSKSPATPGLHRWQISGQTVAISAVNFPDSESDLRPLPSAPTFNGAATATDSFERQAALSRGIPLWPWLVATAIACLLLESLIHIRQSRPIPA